MPPLPSPFTALVLGRYPRPSNESFPISPTAGPFLLPVAPIDNVEMVESAGSAPLTPTFNPPCVAESTFLEPNSPFRIFVANG